MPKKVTKKVAKKESQEALPLKVLNPEETATIAKTCLAVLNYEGGAVPNTVRGTVPLLENVMQALLEDKLYLAMPMEVPAEEK